MFGGHGISTGGLTLALVADLGRGPTLWLKAGPDTRAVFETAGCQRFTYQAKGKARSLGFCSSGQPGQPGRPSRRPRRWRVAGLLTDTAAGVVLADAQISVQRIGFLKRNVI